MDIIMFFFFAIVIITMYLSIRRQWTDPGLTAAGGALGSIVTMVLFMLARDTSIEQGLVVGILVGALFAVATLSIAWYFHSNELRAAQPSGNNQAESAEYYDD